jgi:hypothetical protein
MSKLKPGTTYIYESPDGGQTVYAREFNSLEKILVGRSYMIEFEEQQQKEDSLWRAIRAASADNSALQDAMDHVIMIYNLTNTNDQ